MSLFRLRVAPEGRYAGRVTKVPCRTSFLWRCRRSPEVFRSLGRFEFFQGFGAPADLVNLGRAEVFFKSPPNFDGGRRLCGTPGPAHQVGEVKGLVAGEVLVLDHHGIRRDPSILQRTEGVPETQAWDSQDSSSLVGETLHFQNRS